VQYGPFRNNAKLTGKHGSHCRTSCNCYAVKIACGKYIKFVDIKKKYPQKEYVGSYCPKGYSYVRHVCGKGARKWTGIQKTQYGPYSHNPFLTDKGHCTKQCDCHKVRVECQKN
jgi:hypothetical protein